MRKRLWIACAAVLAAQALAAAAEPRWPSLEGGGAYVLFMSAEVTVVNGTSRDLTRARGRRTSLREELFWFERAGGEYVIRDPAAVLQIKAVFEPQMRLAQQQAALAARQAQIAEDQASVEAQLSDLLEQQTAVGDRMASLAAEQVSLQEKGEDTSSVEAEMEGLEQGIAELGQPQADLASQRVELFGEQQSVARQLEDLGRRQEQAARDGDVKLNGIVTKALAAGTAAPARAKAKDPKDRKDRKD